MSPVRVAAIADVHSPRLLPEFKEALSRCTKPELFLFAGDMVNRGAAGEYLNVLDAVDSTFGSDIPIVACFGNEDPYGIHHDLHKEVKDRVTFLNDESISFKFTDKQIGIVGMSTVTPESRDIAGMKEVFDERVSRLEQLLQITSEETDYLVLLMHFSPLQENTKNEYSWWVSNALDSVHPNLIIHGHIHDATSKKVEKGATTILNVALPFTGSITELTL